MMVYSSPAVNLYEFPYARSYPNIDGYALLKNE